MAVYTDYDRFEKHEMDAVILANYFHQHAPFAIKALNAGLHVMSETAACHTLAVGVALMRAVGKNKKIHMFAENYPYMVFNQEMRWLYQASVIGEFKYGEDEYVHPMLAKDINSISSGVNHWRNWIPATYYCTHFSAPVMFITDTRPVEVSGFVIPYDYNDQEHMKMTARRNDVGSMIVLRMDNGAVVKLLQAGLYGHGNWVRIHGNQGLMENLRVGDTSMFRVRKEPFAKKESEPAEKCIRQNFRSMERKRPLPVAAAGTSS